MNAVTLLKRSTDPLGPLRMDQAELAAALNVTQPAVSQWIAGRRSPAAHVVASVERAWEARSFPGVEIGKDIRGRAIRAPAHQWVPVFRPAKRFRLPLHLDWSGSSQSRWRDARDPEELLAAFAQVIDEGSVGDVVSWVDPEILSEFWPLVPIARSRRDAWTNHLESLGYRVTHVAV